MPTTTGHPHPGLIDPRNWCTHCHDHVAVGMLCPVCLDDQTHSLKPTPSRPSTTLDSQGHN